MQARTGAVARDKGINPPLEQVVLELRRGECGWICATNRERGRDGTVYQTPYVSARANTIPQDIQSLSPAHHTTYAGAIRKR